LNKQEIAQVRNIVSHYYKQYQEGKIDECIVSADKTINECLRVPVADGNRKTLHREIARLHRIVGRCYYKRGDRARAMGVLESGNALDLYYFDKALIKKDIVVLLIKDGNSDEARKVLIDTIGEMKRDYPTGEDLGDNGKVLVKEFITLFQNIERSKEDLSDSNFSEI